MTRIQLAVSFVVFWFSIYAIAMSGLFVSSGRSQIVGGSSSEIVVLEFVLDQVSVTTESGVIRNAGQTQHSLFLRLENRPALTCTTTNLSVFFEQGSSFADDSSTFIWSQLGDAVVAADYGSIGTVLRSNTSGAVQALRVNPDDFDTTNCLLSITYVGSVRPVALFDIGRSQP